jgi:flagellar protein FliL
MATTPPVIQAPVIQAKISSDSVRLPVIPLVVAVVLGIVIAVATVGGVVYYMLRSGKFPVQVAPAAIARPTVKTHAVALEPLLVNLADSSGNAYLRAAITLQVADPIEHPKENKESETKAPSKGSDAAVRDTALAVLGHQSSDALLAPDGKERLKAALKVAIAERNPEIKVTDVFFTEFLVQR